MVDLAQPEQARENVVTREMALWRDYLYGQEP
jgi:hypothetical protein